MRLIVPLALASQVVLLPSATGPVIMLQFTNVTRIQLTVRGWHDIGFGAPQLLLHLSTALPKIQEVTLLDKSHEDMYEPLASTPTGAVAQAAAHAASNLFHAAVGMTTGSDGEGATCDGCGYDTELPDLTCVLMSLLALYPGLKKLEVYTKVCISCMSTCFVVCDVFVGMMVSCACMD